MTTRLLILLASTLLCSASEVNLAWNPSTSTNVSYTLYGSTNSLSQTNYRGSLIVMDCGTNLTAKVSGMTAGQWWFAVTARREFNESDLSNVVVTETPAAPTNMRQLTLQYSMTLTNGSWRDFGNIRLRIESPAP